MLVVEIATQHVLAIFFGSHPLLAGHDKTSQNSLQRFYIGVSDQLHFKDDEVGAIGRLGGENDEGGTGRATVAIEVKLASVDFVFIALTAVIGTVTTVIKGAECLRECEAERGGGPHPYAGGLP